MIQILLSYTFYPISNVLYGNKSVSVIDSWKIPRNEILENSANENISRWWIIFAEIFLGK